MAKKLTWVPREAGDVYCSSACGRGCTKMEYRRAILAGDALAERMGAGWSAHVWENLGWHYKAVDASGLLKCHPTSGGKFIAFLGTGDTGGRWAEQGHTPQAAIKAVRDRARRELKEVQELCDVVALEVK